MLINLKVKTLDAQTHEFSIDNEITVREFKDQIAERTSIAADQQRIIYCGRVLADDKQIKEYDVDGKVVHVAERPPPSQRGPTSSQSNDGTPRERSSTRGGMRNSPLFRALDGMVVGTMAIPMNTRMSNAQLQVNPLTSSFCMNRITVARHMLDCVNNIAAYLEEPERGLNNTSLDILTRGRWTMESAVVEVGITATDLPQNQNIVEMVQGAVSAALRRNGNTNVTVVQLPTVFGSNENDGAQSASDTMESTASVSEGATAAVIIEDVIDSEEEGATNTSNVAQAGSLASNSNSNSSSGAGAGAAPTSATSTSAEGINNSTSTTGTNTDDSPAQRRTGTRVLAEVIDQMRQVQTRMGPFFEQFYDLLQNEPTFEESDVTGRENAQRLYDRVSEAMHYMSHAQHAISDVMLDVSQPAPRYLTCRPIMVEQSGYVSSNNYLSTAALAAAAAARQQQHGANNVGPTPPRRVNVEPPTAPAASSTQAGAANSSSATDATVEDPVDHPLIIPAPAAHVGTQSNDNHQMQMARLIQAVVNSAPIDTEFHVQINAPSIVSFGVPSNAGTAGERSGVDSQQSDAAGNEAPSGQTADGSNTTSAAGAAPMSGIAANQARVNTATLPTTSTQTRSTSRPQLQIGNMPASGWNGRFIPANMMSSFDRFLSCHSHHIREPDQGGNAPGTNGATNAAAAAPPAHNHGNVANNVNPRGMPSLLNILHRGRPATVVGPSIIPPRRSRRSQPAGSNLLGIRNFYAIAPTTAAERNPNSYQLNLHAQLHDFVSGQLFDRRPIDETTIPSAINRAVTWFGEWLMYLPQYEKPEFNSRDSVSNILRRTLPLFIEVVNDTTQHPQLFETRLKQLCDQFMMRLYRVLYVCIGRANAEMYWSQLMRQLSSPIRSNFRNEAVQFLTEYINAEIPSTGCTADVQQFIVRRTASPQPLEASAPMNVDIEMADVASGSSDASDIDIARTPAAPLPNVVVGSAPWHRNFPNDWLPIITRDAQTQSENPIVQGPYSDAYISGMSAKRKKLIQSSKPTADVQSMIADSVRQALQKVGVTTSTASNLSQTADEVTSVIVNDPAIQTSYTEAMRSSVRDRIKNDPDYNADKFPYTTKFVNK